MNALPLLLNPEGELLKEIAAKLVAVRKTKPLWAKRLSETTQVNTLEGVTTAQAGDYLCRGIHDEYWAQKEKKLLEKYCASGQVDNLGFERFEPLPDSTPVDATQIDVPFRVTASWGELKGSPADYVVRSKTDPTDIWIVAKAIFEASYERTV